MANIQGGRTVRNVSIAGDDAPLILVKMIKTQKEHK
jgi:hypothetical protein